MYNEIKELFNQIQYLDNRIAKLQKLKESKEFKNIQIHFFADGKHYTLYQSDTPFSLINELQLLINETIDILETEKQSLKLKF
jgi:hypothetical protein